MSSPVLPLASCAACGASTVLVCASCLKTRFCSAASAAAAWAGHRAACAEWTAPAPQPDEAPAPVPPEERVCSLSALSSAPGRVLEVRLASGRGVAVWLRDGGRLFCLDAACYHHGGPLAGGDIEETAAGGCVVLCPWHRYRIALGSGECLYTAIDAASGAAATRSKGVKQRVPAVRTDGAVDGICEGTPVLLSVAEYDTRTTFYNKSDPGLGAVMRAAMAIEIMGAGE
jgi:nitrite reductase/ring-hydroxylating ferredoxin subunit